MEVVACHCMGHPYLWGMSKVQALNSTTSELQVPGFTKCARHKVVTYFNCLQFCFMYTMNKLYNILKIAPLKSCRGHFISASWICQPQLILRTAHVRMSPNLAVRNTHVSLTGPPLSVELTRAKAKFYNCSLWGKIGNKPPSKMIQCNPDILAIDYSCLRYKLPWRV